MFQIPDNYDIATQADYDRFHALDVTVSIYDIETQERIYRGSIRNVQPLADRATYRMYTDLGGGDE